MRVLEDRIVNAFMDFIEGVKGSSLVMAREETIQFVEGKVEEHKKRGPQGQGKWPYKPLRPPRFLRKNRPCIACEIDYCL